MFFPELIPELHYLLIGLSTILLGIFMDLVLGIVEALKAKKFHWGVICNFLMTNILPYVIVWGLFSSIPVALIYWKFADVFIKPLIAFSTVSFSFIVGELLTSIWGHVKRIGIPVETS